MEVGTTAWRWDALATAESFGGTSCLLPIRHPLLAAEEIAASL